LTGSSSFCQVLLQFLSRLLQRLHLLLQTGRLYFHHLALFFQDFHFLFSLLLLQLGCILVSLYFSDFCLKAFALLCELLDLIVFLFHDLLLSLFKPAVPHREFVLLCQEFFLF